MNQPIAPAVSGDCSPVFVIGAVRSGASLVSFALGQHRNFMEVERTGWLEPLLSGLYYAYRMGVRNRNYSQLDITGIELGDFLEQFGESAQALMMRDLRGSAEDPSPEPAEGQLGGQPYQPMHWVDSSPENTFAVPGLIRLFPNARFIQVVRDVEEVVASLTSLMNRQLYKSRYMYTTEKAAYDHWMQAVGTGIRAEAAYGSETVLRVRRQDLIQAPDAELRRILAFLDEPFDPACLWAFHSVDPQRTPAPVQEPLGDQGFADIDLPEHVPVPEDTKLAAQFLNDAVVHSAPPVYKQNFALILQEERSAGRIWSDAKSVVPEIPGKRPGKAAALASQGDALAHDAKPRRGAVLSGSWFDRLRAVRQSKQP